MPLVGPRPYLPVPAVPLLVGGFNYGQIDETRRGPEPRLIYCFFFSKALARFIAVARLGTDIQMRILSELDSYLVNKFRILFADIHRGFKFTYRIS